MRLSLGEGLSRKSDGGGGGQNVKGTKFFKHYTLGCTNSRKLILLGVQIYKKLYCCIRYFYTQGFTLKNY